MSPDSVVTLEDREAAPSLPTNYEAEQALLGAILADNRAHERVSEFLAPEHFADPVHGQIYEACAALIEGGQLANAITLKSHFERSGDLADVGGAKYLAELQGGYVPISAAKDYGRTIHALWLRRQMIALGNRLAEDAKEGGEERAPAALLADADRTLGLLQAAQEGTSGHRLTHIGEAASAALAEIEEFQQRGGKVIGVPTGFTDLDRHLGGLRNGNVILLGGRPSMGKSALALDIASHAAAEGHPVLFFSLEMTGSELAGRVLSIDTGIPIGEISRGEPRGADFDRLFEATEALREGGVPLFIDNCTDLTVGQMRSRARRFRRSQGGIGLIIVDYLQLMKGQSDRAQDAVQNVTGISRGLKMLARELGVPVLALSQLNRSLEARDDKRPMLSDLRESGALEQDASVVLFAYREEHYLARAPEKGFKETPAAFTTRSEAHMARLADVAGTAEIIVAKNRQGRPGVVKLRWDGPHTHFRDLHAVESQEQEVMF